MHELRRARRAAWVLRGRRSLARGRAVTADVTVRWGWSGASGSADVLPTVALTDDLEVGDDSVAADERIGFISGFTGSNGLCVITQNEGGEEHAILFTDGRYIVQADRQLEEGRLDTVFATKFE